MSQNIIDLIDLTKMYGSVSVVDHLNLSVRKGEVFGLLGPNGAGKSTTILMMLGLTEPTSGQVKVCDIDSTTNPIEVKRKVGYLPEDVRFYDELTGIENLIYTARLNNLSSGQARQKAKELLANVGLSDEGDKKAGKYSRGMRQRLGLADVLIKSPEVIILDEPTLGIDPLGVQEFLELIIKLKNDQGLTVVLSSHHLYQVQKICDRVGLFVKGKILAEGDVATLSKKLFSDETFIIEAEIILNSSGDFKTSDGTIKAETLAEELKTIGGVISVSVNNNAFQIGCSCDLTAEVARLIVNSGAGLSYLHKKEFGLDEIYNRYFEGGVNHERIDDKI
jgi:ABC-2 type transport system ATP-binding protein